MSAATAEKTKKRPSDPMAPEARMSLRDHLVELRKRLFVSAICIAIGLSLVASIGYQPIIDILLEPYRDVTGDPEKLLTIIDPTEGFTTRIKVGTYGGLFLASPVWLFQIWRFITPALTKKEKRYAIPFIVSSILLFAFGAAIAFYTLPQALKFLVTIGGTSTETLFSPAKYIGLVVVLIVAFGVCFEFPVVLVALQLAGAVSSKQLLKGWRYAIVIVVVIAAVATPSQDPVTLMFMAVPMWIFYFGAIGIGKLMKK
jgi:sec-independent protein translocase protein TatC